MAYYGCLIQLMSYIFLFGGSIIHGICVNHVSIFNRGREVKLKSRCNRGCYSRRLSHIIKQLERVGSVGLYQREALGVMTNL